MTAALLLDTGAIFVTQAAVQSIVVATLVPDPGAAFIRWTDALVGGLVAIVAATVVPRAPLRRTAGAGGPGVAKIAEVLRSSAASLEDGDVERALSSLRDARATDPLVAELRAAADEGLSVVASSPFRVGTASRCGRWPIWSSRWTSRCETPGCSRGGWRSPATGASRCRPGTPPWCANWPGAPTRWRPSWRRVGSLASRNRCSPSGRTRSRCRAARPLGRGGARPGPLDHRRPARRRGMDPLEATEAIPPLDAA